MASELSQPGVSIIFESFTSTRVLSFIRALSLLLERWAQTVVRLRGAVTLGGAGALERQGFLDSAQELLAAAGGTVAHAALAEAQLRIRLAQVRIAGCHNPRIR